MQWALRYAFGVGVPLFLGVATDRLLEGVAISGGALMVGLTDSGGPYRGRVTAMLLTCFTVTLSTFVGEISAHSDALAILLLAVTSFGAGMYIAMGVATYFVALMVPLSIVVVTSLPADALHAAERAGLIFVGGLFAVALVLVGWRRHARLPEREAIAKVYRALAALGHRRGLRPAPGVARAGRGAADPRRVSGTRRSAELAGEAFRVLTDEADRTYLDLVALGMPARTSRRGTLGPLDAGLTSAGRRPPRRSPPSRTRSKPVAGEPTSKRSGPASTRWSPLSVKSSRAATPPPTCSAPTSSRRSSTAGLPSAASFAARSISRRRGRARVRRPRIPFVTLGRGLRTWPCARRDRSCGPTSRCARARSGMPCA